MSLPTNVTIRPATSADLPALVAVWYATEVAGEERPPPAPAMLPDLPHILAHGSLLLAERNGQVVGFAGAVLRDGVAFLTDLFVHPGEQSGGVGALLLGRIFAPHGMAVRCTIGSADPRALSLYIRAGMQPQWQFFLLTGRPALPERLPASAIVAAEALPGDPKLIAWDAAIGGRRRPEDHRHWVERQGGAPLWLLRDGERIGYGYARLRAGTMRDPTTARLGPLGVRSGADAREALVALVAWTAQHAPTQRIELPGPHPALADLLGAGFRIDSVDTFLSSAPTPFFDPVCYIGSGGSLL
ncbi:MAG TPA: GNAT family N-acetyltransferase [Roseiflexaceae bacterium]|nr:GNAT family N-acetyltransferase [Roseiflexaceae bacterium]